MYGAGYERDGMGMVRCCPGLYQVYLRYISGVSLVYFRCISGGFPMEFRRSSDGSLLYCPACRVRGVPSCAGGCGAVGERSEEAGLLGGVGLEAEFLVAEFGGDAALGGAFEVAFHDEVGLVDFFEGVGFFADGDGQ